jgi:hypothetical protein
LNSLSTHVNEIEENKADKEMFELEQAELQATFVVGGMTVLPYCKATTKSFTGPKNGR